MIVIDKSFHVAVVCYALDYLVKHGDIDDDLEREFMSMAAYLYPKYLDELESMRNERNKQKLNP